MNLPIRLLPEAKAEFDAAADWYEQQRRGLGLDFVTRIREVFKRLAVNPKLYAMVYRDVRQAIVTRFPYVVLYREEPGGILVISVFHTAQDPTPWKTRAK
ncbi:MAG: type II toxin-antitoxin system RelE/ParE family toxin [Proteobacteria bacterium]|nr:type II toxin-antitoxin system RelE/ParE family toxin [Pseudomonadota bacterium]